MGSSATSASYPGVCDNERPRAIWWRRIFAVLFFSTAAFLMTLMASSLSGHAFNLLDFFMLVAFAVTLPWSVIGFWNAVQGFILMRCTRDSVAVVASYARRIRGDEAIVASTAILVCVRNEDPRRLSRNLGVLAEGLVLTGAAGRFHLYIISDTNRPEIAEAEEAAEVALAARYGQALGVTYRRRAVNTGYKAGNIRDFCERWGGRHDFAIVLDADSVMAPETILRLVRIMQANERLGIVQTLAVGMPTASGFARIFQFGMRLGLKSYTIGGALWQADCGPYWGHNAIIRLAPFIAQCHLPVLPGRPPLGGHVLSHDQVEAVLMRRAGFEVRVLPEEDGSWEENPPTLLEFIRRDLRWCQGNMQYWRLLALPGLRLISRCQLVLAIVMYLGSPGWLAFMVLAFARARLAEPGFVLFRSDSVVSLFAIMMTMTFAAKIASIVDVLTRAKSRQAFGGAIRFLAGALTETVFSMLLSPMMAVAETVFLGSLLCGRTVGWTAQQRDDHGVPLSLAARKLWPQTLMGIIFLISFAGAAPIFFYYSLPIWGALLGAIPFAMVTAHAAVGNGLVRLGLCAIPEERSAPETLCQLHLPALDCISSRGQRTVMTPEEAGAEG
jgi:membrane glycosyltransferase